MKSIQTPQTQTNFIKHQELFYEIVKSVDVINCSHIALYQALFRCWNFNYFVNPVQYPRDQIMGMAGIRSKSVYYKIIRELESLDLIRYYPSKSIYAKSHFCISTIEREDEKIFITLWGLSNHQNLSDTDPKQTQMFRDENQGKLRQLSNLVNGKGQLVLLKKYAILESNFLTDSEESNGQKSDHSQSDFNPLTDPKYASFLDNRISSPSNNSNYANHQNSQSRNSNLRPPGIQIDPEADYSIRL